MSVRGMQGEAWGVKRKYRELKQWREKHRAKADGQFDCAHCLKAITKGQIYERRVYAEASELFHYETLIVMREHMSPGCNQYER